MSTAQKLTGEQAAQLYNGLRSKVDLSVINWGEQKGMNKVQFETIHKVANSSTQEEFTDFIINNQVPAIKLSAKEMEMIKGGVVPIIAYVAYGLMAAYYGKKLFF
jgi:hypothetical protein